MRAALAVALASHGVLAKLPYDPSTDRIQHGAH